MCYSFLLALNLHLALTVDAVVCVELLLQLDDSFVALVKSCRESNHNVSLLNQKLLVTIYLSLILFDLITLTLDFLQSVLILLTNLALLFLKGNTKLRRFFYLLSADEHLRIHHLDLLFEFAFLLLLH